MWGLVAALAGSQQGLGVARSTAGFRVLGGWDRPCGRIRHAAPGVSLGLCRRARGDLTAARGSWRRPWLAERARSSRTGRPPGSSALREWQPLDVDVIAPVEAGRKIDGDQTAVRAAAGALGGRDLEGGADDGRLPGDRRLRRDPRGGGARRSDRGGGASRGAPRSVGSTASSTGRGAATPNCSCGCSNRGGATSRASASAAGWRSKLLPLLSRRGLPIPETNAKLRLAGKTYEIDFLWRDAAASRSKPTAAASTTPQPPASATANATAPSSPPATLSLRLGWEELRDRPAKTLRRTRRPSPLTVPYAVWRI